MAITLSLSLPQPTTQLHLGHGLLESDLLTSLCEGHRIALVADEALETLYAAPLAARLGADLFLIPSGEKAKTEEAKQRLIEQLLEKKHDRNTLLLALGGGTTTDLVGFVASIYLRGVPLILIPTTLLAMVDASIGGKTAINTPFGKNLLGTLYYPKAVVADLNTLQTLSPQERLNGLAEIVKMGLIADATILEEQSFSSLIEKAIRAKISIVEQDPTERGLRRILNFGHTIAHALETVSNYQMPHGQAVAIGCAVESYLSHTLGYLSATDLARIPRISVSLPKNYQRQALLEAMKRDKKNRQGSIRFVLIDQIGRAFPFDGDYCRSVNEKELEPALDWMEENSLDKSEFFP
ncbi:MAG: 3-dehydroquinate synthase [Verrucomicrobiota bacterium]|nr:3-dehydroquinate synthase [Verrucomicrobiota bacterium]